MERVTDLVSELVSELVSVLEIQKKFGSQQLRFLIALTPHTLFGIYLDFYE